MAESSSGYNEKYFENFSTLLSSGERLFNTVLHGTDSSGNISELLTNDSGGLVIGDLNDSYTLSYTGDQLDTITRGSDSKVITLTYTGDNLTAVSDWT
jgi:hypothetical protein